MTITRDSRTGYYKARVKTIEGKTRTLSTRATSRAEAMRIAQRSNLAEIEEAAKAGRLAMDGLAVIISGKRVTMPMAITEYVEWMRLAGKSDRYGLQSKQILLAFSNAYGLNTMPVTAITHKMVFEFINAVDARRSANTRRLQRTVLSGFCDFLIAQKWAIFNPAKAVPVVLNTLSHEQKEPRQRIPFTEEEVATLLQTAPLGTFWHTAVALSRWTGLRLGDIAQLEWECLATPGKIIVFTEKRDKRVSLDIVPELAKALSAVKKTNDKYVFQEARWKAIDPTRRANLSGDFTRLCVKAGIIGKTFHQLRSLYITDCFNRGIPLEHIASRVGHSSTVTTQGYIRQVTNAAA